MAREYARVKLAIWADSDFRKLGDSAQALYFRLITSPTMSLCGVADWRPRRLAALTAGVTEALVQDAARELEAAGYVVVDEETEEVLVRSFIRHDGLIKTPNIAAAMVKDFAGAASETLRGVIVHELNRLHADEPEMKGWSVASKILANPSVNPSEIPSGMASPNPSGNGSHIPQPSSHIPQPPASRPDETPDGFDDFWDVYPRKESKRAARTAYKAALKRAGGDALVILDGAKRYAATKPEPRYTAMATTWLNGDRWGDDVTATQPSGAKTFWDMA